MAHSMNPLYGGIDLGTQGVRIALFDATGVMQAEAHRSWAIPDVTSDFHEQDADKWWARLLDAADAAFASLPAAGRLRVRGLAVASTSGSLLVCDAAGSPLRPAILHSDRRSRAESELCNNASGLHFRPSFSLPKLLWVRDHEPHVWQQTRRALHPADWLTGKLSGAWGQADETNVLKMGYDLAARRWPDFIAALGIPANLLPAVRPSGQGVAQLLPALKQRWGLGNQVLIASGITDSNAVHLASGSVTEGDWTTAIGTAMGIKGIAAYPVNDPSGSIYSHRHPDGLWMVGGASNVGGAVLNHRFGLNSLATLESQLPSQTAHLVYPLEGIGDWFPLWLPAATRFETSVPSNAAESLLATYEGLAFIERLAYDRLAESGLPVHMVTAAGGTNHSLAFLRIRATLLPCPLRTVADCGAAKGAALLAAMACERVPMADVTPRMVGTAQTIPPNPADQDYLADKYARFVGLLRTRCSASSAPLILSNSIP